MPINPTDPPSHVLPEGVQTACDSQFSDLARVRRLRQVSEYHPSRLKLFVRVYNGKATLSECIKAFCLECNGWDEGAIRDCASTACPLHRQRPFQKK
jgi:hypothetical protein